MIQINLLGTVTLLRDGAPFRFERRAQRLLMGLLALDAGQRVSSSHLIEMLWGANAPASARATLHTRISELRALLNRQGLGDGAVELRSVDTGYCLEIAPDNVDSHRFLKLAGGWRRLPNAQAAVDRLAGALELWRGPVFGGLLPESPSSAVEALAAARLTALEDYFTLNLHLGNHLQVVDRLTEAAAANPTRERLTALCMFALTRAGRAAEALTMYANWRAWLREELGTDPGAEVQQVYLAIVRNEDLTALGPHPLPGSDLDVSADLERDSAAARAAAPDPTPDPTTPDLRPDPSPAPLAAPAAGDHPLPPAVVPRTLPPPVDGFVGRDAQTAELLELITGSQHRLIAVSGAAGVGKTALTVHVAHRAADRFPDGQLFADLRGYDEQQPPETAHSVLGRLLRALGVPDGAMPGQLDDRVNLYRQLLADRRMLVILDNVAGDDQVAPLLSAGGSCQIVVTGRTRLGAASGASQLALRAMPDAEARQLLSRIAGPDRVDDDPRGAQDLIRQCGNLPLALRIAGAKLATKPHWSIAHLVRLLAVDGTRLSYLTHQQLSVASGIGTSFRDLSPQARRLLQTVSTLSLPDIPVWAAAALLDTDERTAECVLEELFDANLADVSDRGAASFPRYRISGLVRDVGRDSAALEIGPEALREARRRVYGACLSMVEAVHRLLYGGSHLAARGGGLRWPVEEVLLDDLLADPAGWIDREFTAITATVLAAAADGCLEESWEIVCAASPLVRTRSHAGRWQAVLESTRDALGTDAHERARAAVHCRLGELYAERLALDRARREFELAADLSARCSDEHTAAIVNVRLGALARCEGDADSAMRLYTVVRRSSDAHLETLVAGSLDRLGGPDGWDAADAARPACAATCR